ncbi:plasmid replication DNA-binding protein [Acinetobacter sp. YH16055]|uniref:plasmid replication DNA-binding protein n=1 Tax=Acinetobacter sp. YH16055 TaxID=2601193 RepID=UPI00211DB0D3|nr:plasmid replication DNA-binding protein [Acinetobacter sp. YH16055]
MNKTKFSIMDASKAFKKSRTTIYESIKSGELSRDHDGLIDLSELIRVYGNPVGVQSSARTEQVQKDVQVHVQSEVENVLKDQISLLKNQLDLANQREKSLMQHIEDLTHRIEFKGTLEQPKQENINKLNESTNLNIATDPRPEIESNYDALTTPGEDNKRIPIPEHVEPEPKKRGLLGRLARAVFTDE